MKIKIVHGKGVTGNFTENFSMLYLNGEKIACDKPEKIIKRVIALIRISDSISPEIEVKYE